LILLYIKPLITCDYYKWVLKFIDYGTQVCNALTIEAASFLAVGLSVVDEQPKRYSEKRVKTPKL